MANDVILIDPDVIRAETSLDFNTSGSFLLPAIVEAQAIDLEEVIGSCLLSALKQRVSDNEVEDQYKVLLEEYIHPFLKYAVLARIVVPITYKMANIGVVTTSDSEVHNISYADVALIKEYYIKERDVFKRRLQRYLCSHRSEFVELRDCSCNGEAPHLESSASTSL